MSQPSPKNIALICHHSPYGSAKARELIDVALAAAAFDQNVSLIFMGAGVLQLKDGQDPSSIEQKNLGKLLSMLELYDIENIFALDSAIEQFGMKDGSLSAAAKVVDAQNIANWLQEQDICVSL
ncbi:sulfurtransferase complex subunit TusC [Pseudoteredinibacter isoporae]|uniref:tRNA 2-thiouridine synthesizing protein C n=1 Tax=Pseudoteredinibacter isoporae TaxID=570281 RepID=A0A7X0MYG1_9GAMM|nr:sulfurtransferase complex subunit TusC [Pseudoteredinibacter isoporae]MBB6521972.1 tRNA 2-thiouridine synthesizing protein C [Pseudoteredinibacter isoporae]NHO87508.1 sulfurtransferase complex subunit TusC [Pseudoteredinibacter isoporae]NIB24161.1 sulfurtransferase complex subunit TusC [Pseudoteredinibacter isoporae]